MARLHLAALALGLLGTGCATPGPPPMPTTGFLFETLQLDGRSYPYAVYVPRAYDPATAWPLVLFLHGRGESGADGSRMLAQGLGPALQGDPASWPALVVLPQKPTGDTEWEQHEAALLALVARVRARYRVDPDRLYLTGLSQGGHGSWVLGARHAGLWAAVVPICGYGPARQAPRPGLPPPFTGSPAELAAALRETPVWAFHGADDDVVPAEETRRLVRALEEAGGEPRVTILPGVNHGAWDPAYRNPALPRWLLAQRRRGAAP